MAIKSYKDLLLAMQNPSKKSFCWRAYRVEVEGFKVYLQHQKSGTALLFYDRDKGFFYENCTEDKDITYFNCLMRAVNIPITAVKHAAEAIPSGALALYYRTPYGKYLLWSGKCISFNTLLDPNSYGQ